MTMLPCTLKTNHITRMHVEMTPGEWAPRNKKCTLAWFIRLIVKSISARRICIKQWTYVHLGEQAAISHAWLRCGLPWAASLVRHRTVEKKHVKPSRHQSRIITVRCARYCSALCRCGWEASCLKSRPGDSYRFMFSILDAWIAPWKVYFLSQLKVSCSTSCLTTSSMCRFIMFFPRETFESCRNYSPLSDDISGSAVRT